MNNVYLNNSNYKVRFCGRKQQKCISIADNPNLVPTVYRDTTEGMEISRIYDNLWKDLELPQKIKPGLEFDSLGSSIMGFAQSDFKIYINNCFSPQKWSRLNKKGYTKAYLRHEIQHVIQLFQAIRVSGKDGYEKILKAYGKNGYIEKDIYDTVINTLGVLSPDSAEGKKALKYIKSAEKYTSPKGFNIISLILYKFNYLERDARKAAKPFTPNKYKLFFKVLKNMLQKV